jgi:hypothetical protein
MTPRPKTLSVSKLGRATCQLVQTPGLPVMVASPQTAARRAVHSEPREAPIRPSGPALSGDTTEILRDFLCRSPAVLESGLRILDTTLHAGDHGVIDLLAVDRDGAPVIVAVASDPEIGLARLLDQYLWASAQRDLLARAYPDAPGAAQRPIRCILVAPAFGASFLGRTALLSVAVGLYVARPIPATDPQAYLVEAAAAIYGIGAGVSTLAGIDPAVETWAFTGGPGPDNPLPPIDPDDPVLRGFDLHTGETNALEPARPVVVEPLTAEELEAFEQFDRQRRVREGAP